MTVYRTTSAKLEEDLAMHAYDAALLARLTGPEILQLEREGHMAPIVLRVLDGFQRLIAQCAYLDGVPLQRKDPSGPR